MFTSRRIKLKMLCLSGFSRETELTVRVYRKSDLLWGVGSCDYGGWKVPTFVGWVGKLETQQKWWCSSKSELEGLRTRRVDGVSSSPKANRLYTQEESMFQFKCEEGKSNIPAQRPSGRKNSLLLGWESAFLFYSGFQLIRQDPHTLEKAMAPHSSTLAWKIPWTEEPGRL